MLAYDRETMLQVIHNRGYGFQKDLPYMGAQIATHARSTSKNQIKTQRGFHDKAITGFIKYFRGPPH